MDQLGNRLRKERKARAWTLQYVADRLGLSQLSTYSNWEYGRREPDAESINKLAELFEVSTDYLLGKTPYKTAAEENNSGEPVSLDLFFRLLEYKTDDEIIAEFKGTFRGHELSEHTIRNLLNYARWTLEQQLQRDHS